MAEQTHITIGGLRVSSVLLGIAGSAALHAAALATLFVVLPGRSTDQSDAKTLIARGQPILVRLVEADEEETSLPEPDIDPIPDPVEAEPEPLELPEPATNPNERVEPGPITAASNWCADTMDRLEEVTAESLNKALQRAIALEQVVSRIMANMPDAPVQPLVDTVTSASDPPAPPAQLTDATPMTTPPATPPRNASAQRSRPQPVGISSGAEVVSVPEPLYPSRSIRLGQEGTVEIEVEVRADGTVGEARIVTSSGHRLLDRAALDAAKRGRYQPAKENGRAVRATILVPFEFNLN